MASQLCWKEIHLRVPEGGQRICTITYMAEESTNSDLTAAGVVDMDYPDGATTVTDLEIAATARLQDLGKID